ncbi:exopolysaccharide biosynthesis polyprenyl glycosylphosphotransferase [Lutibacter sp.]
MPQNNIHFSISERKLLLRVFDVIFAIDGIIFLSLFSNFNYFDLNSPQIYIWGITLASYILLFSEIFEMYNLKVANDTYLTIRGTILTGVLTTIFYIFTPIISPVLPTNRIQIVYLFLAITVSITIWRFIYIKFIFSPKFFKRVLLIGPEQTIKTLVQSIHENAQDNDIVGYISTHKIENCEINYIDIYEEKLINIIKKLYVTEIVVETFDKYEIQQNLTPQLIKLFEKGYTITSAVNFKESLQNRVPESCLDNDFFSYIGFSKSQHNRLYLFAHRAADILVSIIGILFLVLIIPFVVIGNLIGNRGNLFYLQKRVGKKGKVFYIIKFRSMVPDAEKNGPAWAKKNDTRITKFGRFLRRTRLDEVPQFINVLRGDMGLIGPRPERPEFVRKLSKEFPFYAIRHVIKPGLTGWAQVEFPYASSKEEQSIKLRYDLYYIKERNLLLDLKIIIKTISTVLFFRGT